MEKITTEDLKFMSLAIREAYKAKGKTLPNPAVGAVIVKNGKVISKAFHEKAGQPHAEALAIERAGDKARGATLYVTLEPCNHYGKTPPCTEKIIKAGIKEVVIGIRDPNPIASGGVERLKAAGIKVKENVFKKRCFELIEDFIVNVKYSRPFVSLKLASTLDGFIADEKGNSKWITSKKSRTYVHKLRSYHNAVMVGIGTVLKDDPLLNVRYIETSVQPKAVVVDRDLKIPLNARLIKRRASELIVITSEKSLLNYKAGILKDLGVKLLPVSSSGKYLDLAEAFKTLREQFGIYSIMCEGGSGLAGYLLENNLIDKFYLFYAMKVFGSGIKLFDSSRKELKGYKVLSVKRLGEDFLVIMFRQN
jgi:diaminohydroxyphosphoribosylaminopyrimidine deaminase/5-amino-6-(5-phosphoribosylamino)uracil reductase